MTASDRPWTAYDDTDEQIDMPPPSQEWQDRYGWKNGEPPDDNLGIWDASTIDPATIPPRGWLLGNSFCRKFLASLIADGGVGKTALRIAQAIALATGRHDITDEHVFVHPCRVLFVTLEDNRDELNRRVAAAMIHHQITPDEMHDRLILAAPKGMKLLQMNDGAIADGELKAWLDAAVAAYRPDLIIFDPFVKTHALNENDNNLMDIVCDYLATLAIEHDIAIDIPHHTRKGAQTAGDVDQGRGASGIKDATRISDTLTPMSQPEAEQFSIDPRDRTHYVRFDSGKHNLCPAREAKWFHLASVPIGNASETYPAGDHVQTVEVWRPPSLWQDTDSATLNHILDRIDVGLPNGSRYSTAPNATDRAPWRVVADLLPEKTEKQAREIINTWLKTGLLVSEDYHDPVARKSLKGLRVTRAKRPTMSALLDSF
jgi:hypothetical protein